MKILSRYKDYYDYLQKYGQDENIVYTRRLEEIKLNTYFYPLESGPILINHRFWNANTAKLYFCGEYTDIYRVHTYNEKGLNNQIFYLSSLEYYPSLSEKIEKRKEQFSYKLHNGDSFIDKKIIKIFEKNKPDNVPIAILDHARIIYNPTLQNIGIANIYPAEQAYQRIAQYLANVDSGSKTKYKGKEIIPKISDKDMAAAKGFDKFSFRKERK